MFATFNPLEWAKYGLLGVVGVVALVAAIYLGWGLFQARSLIRREFSAYFLSPIAYVVLVVFLIVTAWASSMSPTTVEATAASTPPAHARLPLANRVLRSRSSTARERESVLTVEF